MPATSEHTSFPGDCGSGGAQYLQETWNPIPSRPLPDMNGIAKTIKVTVYLKKPLSLK